MIHFAVSIVLSVLGAKPVALALAYVLEEGLDVDVLIHGLRQTRRYS